MTKLLAIRSPGEVENHGKPFHQSRRFARLIAIFYLGLGSVFASATIMLLLYALYARAVNIIMDDTDLEDNILLKFEDTLERMGYTALQGDTECVLWAAIITLLAYFIPHVVGAANLISATNPVSDIRNGIKHTLRHLSIQNTLIGVEMTFLVLNSFLICSTPANKMISSYVVGAIVISRLACTHLAEAYLSGLLEFGEFTGRIGDSEFIRQSLVLRKCFKRVKELGSRTPVKAKFTSVAEIHEVNKPATTKS